MQKITKNFTISYEGWDLTAKNLSKLLEGASLSYERICDDMDTFEIVITHDNTEIDMLSYEDSLSLAAYLDLELLKIDNMILKNSEIIKGKTNAQNIINLNFSADILFDDEYLTLYNSSKGYVFLSRANRPLSMAIIALNDYEENIIEQTFLNQYTFSIDIDEDSMFLFPEIDFEEDKGYYFGCEILLNEDFSKCKISSYIQDENEEKTALTLSEFEKETFLELVNHYRIFKEEDTLNPEIEN